LSREKKGTIPVSTYSIGFCHINLFGLLLLYSDNDMRRTCSLEVYAKHDNRLIAAPFLLLHDKLHTQIFSFSFGGSENAFFEEKKFRKW
jgi:hypothetical protein